MFVVRGGCAPLVTTVLGGFAGAPWFPPGGGFGGCGILGVALLVVGQQFQHPACAGVVARARPNLTLRHRSAGRWD